MSLPNLLSNGETFSCVDLKKEFNENTDSGQIELNFMDQPCDLHNKEILCLNRKLSKGVFKCEYCNFRCRKLGTLQRHIPIHFQVILKNIKSYSAEDSIEKDQRIHICEECGAVHVFTKLKTSFQIKIYKDDSEDSCVECSNKFIKVADIRENVNLEQHDEDKMIIIYPDVKEEIEAHNSNDDSGYMEDINIKQEKQIIVKQEEQSSTKKNHDIHNKKIIIKEEKYENNIAKKYKNKSDAKFRPYACSTCTFRSVEENTLKKHLRTHFIEKKFTCPHCSYKGEKAMHLKNHLKTHSDEKPHGCSHCQYRTNNLPNLKRHERHHTGERPFPCTECDYRAVQKIALQNHMKSKHSL